MGIFILKERFEPLWMGCLIRPRGYSCQGAVHVDVTIYHAATLDHVLHLDGNNERVRLRGFSGVFLRVHVS